MAMNNINFSNLETMPSLATMTKTGYVVGMSIGTVLITACLVFLLYFIIKNRIYYKLLKRLGVIAEQAINSDISLWARHTRNKFIPGALFHYGNNNFFEVDSILLTDRALIVIETKSIKGGIRGSANDTTWTKVLDKTNQPIKNVVHKNDLKINHLKNFLNIKIPTISLIVFSNKATFIDLTDLPSHVVVTKHTDIFHTLDEINKSLEPKIDKEMKRKIIRKLKAHITYNSREKVLNEQSLTKGHVL